MYTTSSQKLLVVWNYCMFSLFCHLQMCFCFVCPACLVNFYYLAQMGGGGICIYIWISWSNSNLNLAYLYQPFVCLVGCDGGAGIVQSLWCLGCGLNNQDSSFDFEWGGGDKRLFTSHKYPAWLWVSPSLLGTWVFFLRNEVVRTWTLRIDEPVTPFHHVASWPA